jgi:hypothetical protein
VLRTMTNRLFLSALAIGAASMLAGCGSGSGSVLPVTPLSAARGVRPMDTAGGTPFAASCAASTASTARRAMDTAGGTPFASAARSCAAPSARPMDTAGGTPFGGPVHTLDTAGGTPFGK